MLRQQLVSMQRLLQGRFSRLPCGPLRLGWAQPLPAAQTLARPSDCQTAQQQPARHLSATSGGEAAPPPAAAAGGGGSAASSSSGPTFYQWREGWRDFLKFLHAEGHFAADPGVSQDTVDENAGAMKRAVLSLGRARPDILHTLDGAKLKAVVLAGYPVDDRKTKNAHRRLRASLVDGRHLAPGDGGPAEFQDLLRVFLSLAACDQRDFSLFAPLSAGTAALLPDIGAAAAAPPSPEAAAAAATQSSQRYMPHRDNQEPAARPPPSPRPDRERQLRQDDDRREQQPFEDWWQGGDRDGGGGGRGGGDGGRGAGAGGSGGRGGGGRYSPAGGRGGGGRYSPAGGRGGGGRYSPAGGRGGGGRYSPAGGRGGGGRGGRGGGRGGGRDGGSAGGGGSRWDRGE